MVSHVAQSYFNYMLTMIHKYFLNVCMILNNNSICLKKILPLFWFFFVSLSKVAFQGIDNCVKRIPGDT